MTRKDPSTENKSDHKYIEVWEDMVALKDLVLSLIVCSVTSLGGYFLAPNEPPMPLFFGLGGALLGFLILSFLIQPKRHLTDDQEEA